MVGVAQAFPVIDTRGRQVMQTPEDVAQMLRLRAAGLGVNPSPPCRSARARAVVGRTAAAAYFAHPPAA